MVLVTSKYFPVQKNWQQWLTDYVLHYLLGFNISSAKYWDIQGFPNTGSLFMQPCRNEVWRSHLTSKATRIYCTLFLLDASWKNYCTLHSQMFNSIKYFTRSHHQKCLSWNWGISIKSILQLNNMLPTMMKFSICTLVESNNTESENW
jgi:hypothetical protein